MNKIVALVGPTASGKSNIAKKILSQYPDFEAISIDSRQVFRKLDLGTGKDKSFPQYLIDIKNPGEDISVVEIQDLALKSIKNIFKKNKIPLLVGGSNYFMDSIIYKRQYPVIESDINLQQKLEKKSLLELFTQLKKIDPDRANNIDPKNKQKLIRALEINIKTGEKTQKKSVAMSKKYRYQTLILGVDIDRTKLYEKIDKRVDERIEEGMIREVRNLISDGVSKSWLKKLGLEYLIITEYLEAKYTKSEMINILKYKIHAFARRQLTWLRSNKDIVWIRGESEAIKEIDKFMI